MNRFVKLEKMCHHFHLSLQSGCTETLKRMNRRYTAEEFENVAELLRSYYDDVILTTDIIVGFPGETDEEFEETYAFLQKVKFYEMHVFKYSMRNGTLAAKMKEQVDEQIKTKRSQILIKMDRELSEEYRKAMIGNTVDVLLEEEIILDGVSYMVGHTKTYVKVIVPNDGLSSNTIITCTLEKVVKEEFVLGVK